jgi:hypothetical protein
VIIKKMQEQASKIPPALLERLGRWQPTVDKLQDVGQVLSEVGVQIRFGLSVDIS